MQAHFVVGWAIPTDDIPEGSAGGNRKGCDCSLPLTKIKIQIRRMHAEIMKNGFSSTFNRDFAIFQFGTVELSCSFEITHDAHIFLCAHCKYNEPQSYFFMKKMPICIL